MEIITLVVGYLATNCYIAIDEATRKCAIIDPGADQDVILSYIESNKLILEAIFLTHGHFDHVLAVQEISDVTGVPVYINERDIDIEWKNKSKDNSGIDLRNYAEGDVLYIGSLEFVILETPGHSPGSITLKSGSVLFTGDTLFRDSCGRTDLEGGDMNTLLASLRRLSELEGDYEVYPGHMSSTTLSRERSFNRYMKATGQTPSP